MYDENADMKLRILQFLPASYYVLIFRPKQLS